MIYPKPFFLFFLLTISLNVFAGEDDIYNYFENMAESRESTNNSSEIIEKMIIMSKKPVNINNSYEEISLLTPFQVYSIKEYIRKYGKIRSYNELYQIAGLNPELINLLKELTTLEEKKTEKYKPGYNNLTRTYYKSSNTKNNIEGKPFNLLIKNKFRLKNMEINLNMENDYGEHFFYKSNKSGFDFYSGNIAYSKNKYKIIAGDYEIGYGTKIAVGGGYQTYKTTDFHSLYNYKTYLKPYTSINEYNYMRGISFSRKSKKHLIIAYYSGKKIDAKVINDTAFSMPETGIHSKNNEIKNEKKLSLKDIGIINRFSNNKVSVSMLNTYSFFNNETKYISRREKFHQFYLKDNLVNSLFLKYAFKHGIFFNEISLSNLKYPACYSGLIGELSPFTLFGTIRYYSQNYYSYYSKGYSSGSSNSNEIGFLFGIAYQPTRKAKIAYFHDLYKHPDIKYNIPVYESNGQSNRVKISYNFTKNISSYLRVSSDNKPYVEINDNGIYETKKSNLIKTRINAKLDITETSRLILRYENSSYKSHNLKDNGNLAFAEMKFTINKHKLYTRFTMFKTRSFESRIYTYEYNVLYSGSIPSFFGNGKKFYLIYNTSIFNKIKLWVKFSTYSKIYKNQNQINYNLYFQIIKSF